MAEMSAVHSDILWAECLVGKTVVMLVDLMVWMMVAVMVDLLVDSLVLT